MPVKWRRLNLCVAFDAYVCSGLRILPEIKTYHTFRVVICLARALRGFFRAVGCRRRIPRRSRIALRGGFGSRPCSWRRRTWPGTQVAAQSAGPLTKGWSDTRASSASKCIPGPNQAVAITDVARGFKRSRRHCFLTLLLLDRRPSTFTARPYCLLTSPWTTFPRTAHCFQRGHLRGAKHINQTRRTQA